MHRLSSAVFVLLTFFTQACVNQQTIAKLSVAEVGENEVLNAVSMGCNSPYSLPQDCDVWQGANRMISIDGNKIRIGGSENGRLVLIMPDRAECSVFATDCVTITSNRNARLILDLLQKEGFRVEKVVPVATIHIIAGYLIFLNKDGYTFLKKLSVS
jgi:hypothetical protein